ncbi:VCBS domain-containing protein [Bradyrhizobium sp. 183]|uniref:VCBS domain-containing protein n=2 Tax=Bradyrhizobium TaxID=374 RepID=UPI001FFE4462|nr:MULTISPECIES: VCBS domain-containing protein [unclassified Bradyrhizobium]UPJ78558.1 VCBS domain-containing protein [Bradyrhizobium sp. 184]UPJ86353.1 VCBS domain-containing protein [Bradyrhizobium sp. 183]
MATQATGGGSTVSFGNTPQANTDIFSFAEDASNILILNVLANDLGGAAKTLFSLDDGMSSSASTKNYAPADLLVKDVAYSSDAAGMAATGDRSALGARIWIEADGTVHYDKGDINVQLQALATGQTLTDTFTYAIQLGNGTLSWATVTLQFNGANDSVFITSSPQSGSVVEDANATPDFSDSQSAAGTISFNDADLNDTHSASFAAASSNTTSLGTFSLDPVNEAPNAANGAVQWHYNLNNAAAQYLAAGQTVAESFVVTINDGHGSTATQTVTVTITGTNDIVSITSGVQSGAVVEDAPSTPSLSDSLATAGSISFNDVDLSDGHTATFVAGAGNTTALGTFSLDPVSEAANAANGSVQWHYALNSAAAQYLAEGQSVTESFVVTINDGHGSTATQTVTVTTTGTNDIVSITSGVQSGSVVEDAPATPDPSDSLTTAGTISFTDVDLSDGHTATFVAAPANTSALGTFSLDTVSEGANTASGSVQWHYNLNNAAAQYLAAGQSVVEHYAVTVSDGQGSTVTQDVAITIAGANDVVSVTSGVQAGTVVEDAPATPDPSDSLTAAGTVSFTDVDLSDGHTATFVVAPANTTALGTFSLGPVSEAANAANGSVQWHYNLDNVAAQHLAAGQSVTESFVVTVNDGHGSTATQTVTITLTGTNDTPVAVADTNSGLEDSTITGSVATNDSDVDDGATLTYAQTSAVAGLTINADGSYSFEASNAAYQHLAEGATQVVVANYTVTDEHGASAPSTLTITLTGTNDTPVAVADTNSGLEDSTITGSVATNDSDVDDGATLTYAQTSAVAGLTINADGSYSFEASNAAYQHLAEGATQVVVANYTVTDEHGASAPSTLTITLTGTNDTPVAVADTNSGLEDSTITGSVATNDSDVDDGATLTYAQTSAVAGLTINADGSYSFEASNAAYQHLAEGATQVVVANYTVTDEHGASAPSTLTITLTGTNDTPVAVADTNSGLEDSTITGSVATNDSDVDDGATLTYAQTSAVAGLTINADGSYSFEASNAAYQHLAEGATQVVVANYTVTDEHGASAPSTLTITLTGTNDTPVAVADTNSGLEDSTITGSVATNDSDVDDGATLTYAQTSAVAGLTINADGSYSFEASNAAYQHLAEGATQVVVANYTVTDEHGASAPSTLTITLTGTNDTPVAVADTNSGLEDSTITGSVATNDSDVDDGATLTYAQTSAVAGLTINADGSYSFEASNAAYQHLAEGATQVVVANYTVTDEHGASAPSTLTITLTGTNDTPVAVADTNSGLEDSTITGSVATNDSDVDDGATLTYAQTSAVAGLTINADGSYSFEASNAAYQHLAEGATQVVVANYTVTDEHGASAPSTLTITLTGTNDTPVAVADTNSGLEDSTITGSVATNDSDVDDGATLTYAQTSAVAGLTINADGSYSFEASNAAYQHLAEGATQVVVANYTVTDEHGASAPSTLTITLTGTNDTPVAVADTNSGLEDSTITGSVATNDSDVDDGATLTYAQTSAVAGLTINADGSYSFEASNAAYQHLAEGATQVVVANYTVTDEHGASAPSTLTITLTGTNDTPVAVADTNSGLEDSTITGSVATNDSDVDDGATLTYAQTSAVAGLTINADGSYSFEASNAAYQHLAEGATQVVVANYTVTDEHGASAPSTLTITLTGTNDTPVAVADTNSGLEDSTITGSVATNDSDVDDGATLTYAQTSAVAGLTINADGSYSFEASNAAYQHLAEGATQVVVANYTVTDEHGASAPSTLTITLTGTNDTPVAVADTNSGLEDSTITGSVATNDSDVDDGATLTYAQTSAVAGLTINADGSYSFEASNAAYQHLAEGATQVVVANYTVTDEHGASAPSTLTITLTGTNDTPVAVADTNSGLEDSTITGSVATNDSDVDDGATLTYAQTSAVAGLTINADGSYSFEASNAAYQHLAEGATQVVVANYTVTDEHGASAPSTLTITLTGTNDTPVAVADTNSGLEDSTITGSVATNDSDVDDGATLTYAQTSAVAGLTINADGSYSFEASNAAYQHLAEGATQVVVANYTVTDEHGASAPSTLTITLTGTNDTPVAVADTNSGLEDSTITGSVATNDSDVDDGATLTYAQTSAVAGLTINADGSYSFEASNAAYQHLAEGATQVVVANYTVTDEHGASAPSTLTITLTGTNDTPVAVADTNSGLEDSTITGSVATNDSDVDDGATLTYAQTSAVAGLTINADGSYSFEASNAAYQHLAEGATQVVVANYTVTDEHGASAPSTLTITLTGTNDTPVAVADTNSGLEDSTITGSVATNDSDVDDGATLTYAQTSAVAGLTINADGSYSFEASNAAYQHLAEGATQVVVANYTVTDEHGASAPSTLTITLTGTNDTPVAVADTNSGLEDSTITGSVATNDSDVDDGATLTYAQTSAVAGLTINADGSYSFEASNAAYQHLAEGATQVVVANYTVTDEHGASAPSTLTITLTGTNDTPVAVADTNSGLEDSTITGSVATNDSDVDDGATLTYAQTSAVAGLTINADGSYSFEASNAAYQHLAEGATQVVVANYTVTDEHGASAPSTLTITLTGTNDTPVAVADTNSGLEDSTITGSVATNDSDVDDGATLTYAQTSAVAGLTINADGSYSFEASNAAYQHLAEGATQVVVANYTVTDEHGASAPSTLTITLTGTNDTPVAVADTNSGLEDSTITGSVATNDSDVDDGATLTYAQTSAVAGLTINADGSYSFEASNAAYQHLAEGATQVVVANYTVTDEHGASAPSTLTITLTGTNDTPVAVADTNSGLEDSTITGSVATNDSDVDDGATLTYAQTSAVAGLTINADGSYSFEASNAAYQHLAEGATQVVVANYTVTDEHGASAPSTLTITLTGTNDTPVAVADTNSGLEDSTITGSVATNDSDVDDGATLTYAQTSAVAGLTINADGSYSFEASNAAYQHLAEGATQVVVANYTVTDEHGASAPSTLTITLTGTNDTPVAVADTNSGLEDSTITGSVATNDSDVDDGATLTYAQTSAVAGLTINADGSYSFEASNAAYQHLAEGATQVVVANYTVTDEHGASAPSTLTITLTGTNDTPVAVADTNSGLEDSTITGSVATNDSDVDDGATLTYAQTSAVAGLTINADGSYSFEASNAAYQHLAEGATQVVVANYTVTDEHGASAPSTLTITLTGTNDTPVAVADTNSGLEDSTITGSVATNDSDVDDGATLTYAQTSAVAGLTINADGSYSFEASNAAYQHLAEGATQVVVANYTVTDEHGASAPSTLTITLTGTNDTPVAVADTNSGLEDSTITGSVATNDSDVDDGATLTYAQTSAVAGLTINADGSYSFEASNAAYQHLAEGATQVVVANYTVTDEHGASAPSTLTITLTGTNDTPVAVADTNSGLEDSTITGSVATNDSDVDDGATLTYAQTSAVAGLTINADGSYSFEASNAAYQHLAEGATQVVVANYTVTDEHGASAPSTLTITLTGTNDTPVAVADTNSGLEDSTITGSVATNDSDVDDGATLTYAQTSAVAGLTINADGSYSFEASNAAYQHLAEGATQVVVANYTVTDEHGASAPSTLTITLTGTNDTPVAVAGHTLNYTENHAATAIDPALTVSDVDNANLVSATVQITGNYVNGQDVLGFTNQNGITGSFNAATGTLTLTGSSSVANYQTALDSVTYFNTSDNPSGLARTVTIITNDGAANSVAVTDTINVTPVNDAPVLNANGGTLSYTENQAATAIDTVLTASDVDSTNLTGATVSITTNFASGQDVLGFTNQNGITGSYNAGTGVLTLTGSATVANYQAALRSVTYSSSSDNPSGATRTISYQVDDGAGANHASNIATSTVAVTPVNDAPVLNANGGTLSYTENQAATAIDTVLTASDVDSTNLTGATVSITTNFASGQDVLGFTNQNGITGSYNAGTGVLTLTGSATVANYQAALRSVTYSNSSDNPSGATRTISYQVDDGAGANHASNIATSTVAVTPVNDAPVAQNDAYILDTSGGNILTVTTPGVLTNDSDPDSAITAVKDTNPTHGTVTLNPNGSFTYTRTDSFLGTDSFTYHTSDGSLSSNPVTVTITLAGSVSGHVINFGNGTDIANFANNTFDGNTPAPSGNWSVLMGNGGDTLVTAWNHINGTTTYNGGNGADDITLVFSSTQLEQVLSNATFEGALQNYFNGSPTGTLDFLASSWQASATAFENGNLALALNGGGAATYSAIADDLPNLLAGLTGNPSDNTLVGTANGETISGNDGNDIVVGLGGDDTLNGGNGSDLLLGGSGNDTLTGGAGIDILSGGTGNNTFRYTAVTDSNHAGFDIVTDFASGSDKIAATSGLAITSIGTSLATATSSVAAHTFAWFVDTANNQTIVYGNATNGALNGGTASLLEIHLAGVTSLTATDFATGVAPAGIAGEQINLGLTDPSSDLNDLTTVTVSGVPLGWSLNAGTNEGNGTWTVQTNDVRSLAVTTLTDFAGAVVLNVAETWTEADGSTGTRVVFDNIEAYAAGSPIFAISGDDNLTASSGNDLLVFAQPIGRDTIYNFDTAHDQIDLVGYAEFTGFGDIQAHTANDTNGNAVISAGEGQSITLHGVDASSLTASDFIFDQTPVTENAGHMVIADGAILPLSGIIDNTGTIELNSSGSETDLELIEHGITLQGHGQVILSDSSENVITGTVSDVTLTNVDNTISGAGHLGDGMMVLVNEGTIIATGTNALDIDTGANAVTNTGTIEATGTGGLEVHSDLVNTGVLWANGGNVTIDGNVSGNGTAQISGSATLEFGAASSAHVTLDAQATGTIVLHDSFDFSGVVSGFNGDDHLDLLDVAFGAGTTASYVANQAGAGGTLSVTDGVHTANITLLGQYDPAGFQTEADKNTGTLISYHDHLA